VGPIREGVTAPLREGVSREGYQVGCGGGVRAPALETGDAPPQAKQVADIAHAAEVYARRQKLSEEAIEYAHAVKIDALTLMGEFLKGSPKNKGRAGSGRPKIGDTSQVSPKPGGGKPGPGRGKKGEKANTQSELAFGLPNGVSAKESSDAQALADLKVQDPKRHEEVRAGKLTVSQARVEMKRKKKRADLKRKAEAQPSARLVLLRPPLLRPFRRVSLLDQFEPHPHEVRPRTTRDTVVVGQTLNQFVSAVNVGLLQSDELLW